jgi:hypothetical protein
MSAKFDVFRIKDITNHSKMESSSCLQYISVKRSTITVPALDGEEVLLVGQDAGQDTYRALIC